MHSPTSTLAESPATSGTPSRALSDAGKRRLLSKFGEPLFLARWARAVFINYAADPATLQSQVPFELDLFDGRAFVSLVAFTLVRMRPRLGGRIGEWIFRPIATHEFLNVRTYVRHRGEPGIFFLTEWLSNPLSVLLGPRTFGLPYRFGSLCYQHSNSEVRGVVEAKEGRLVYEGITKGTSLRPCDAGSVDEFMMERYTAFTRRGKRARFRIWHQPWEQMAARIEVTEHSLLENNGGWWETAQQIGANYSPGAEVWMGRPHRLAN